MFVNYQNALVN